jgi:hypothetical protein
MSAKTNQQLVQRRFKDLHPQWSELMDRTIGVKDSGYIPLEIPLDVLVEQSERLCVEFSEVFPDQPFGEIISRIFLVRKDGQNGALVCEIDDSLWVTNGDMDDFKKIFFGSGS